MTLEKFIKLHKLKTFLKILTIIIVLLLFFFNLNLDFQDYIDGFGRLEFIGGIYDSHLFKWNRKHETLC